MKVVRMKMEVQRNDNGNPILSLPSYLLTQNFEYFSNLIYPCYMSTLIIYTIVIGTIYTVNITSSFPLLLGLS
jgi:hypothetical protein